MISRSFADWLTEREQKMNPLVFIFEWIFIFIFSLVIFTIFLIFQDKLVPTAIGSTASSALFACIFVYVRSLRATGCAKCGSPLPYLREELDRKVVGEREKYAEVGRSWSQGPASLVDIYLKNCRVERVRFCCRKCRVEWVEEQLFSVSSYRLDHSIDLNDQL